jgi:hypothetical protein
VLALLLLWFVVTSMGWIKPLFLPSPQAVFQQFSDYLTGQANDKPLWDHMLASALRVTVAFWLAFVTAVPIGIAMGMSRIARGIFDPPIEFYRPLPPLAYLPLIIIWFGIDELPKVLLIYLSCFAPLALAARSGMRSASPEQINAAYSLGASRAAGSLRAPSSPSHKRDKVCQGAVRIAESGAARCTDWDSCRARAASDRRRPESLPVGAGPNRIGPDRRLPDEIRFAPILRRPPAHGRRLR